VLLLTGATGSAGSRIVKEFINKCEPIRVLVRNRAKARWLEGIPTVDVVVADMTCKDDLESALDGVERVLMISGAGLDMANTQIKFIDACKTYGVRHVIKFSGLDARPGTSFPFGQMHFQAERYLEQSGLAWTHLQPSGFMQEFLREAPSIVNDGTMYLPLADIRLNPVDLADIGEIGFRLLRDGGHEGERLPITGPELLCMSDIAHRLSRATGRNIRYQAINPQQRWQALVSYGVPIEIADALEHQVFERLKGGLESEVNLSTHRMFGVEPTTFFDFADRNAEAFGRSAELV